MQGRLSHHSSGLPKSSSLQVCKFALGKGPSGLSLTRGTCVDLGLLRVLTTVGRGFGWSLSLSLQHLHPRTSLLVPSPRLSWTYLSLFLFSLSHCLIHKAVVPQNLKLLNQLPFLSKPRRLHQLQNHITVCSVATPRSLPAKMLIERAAA